MKQLNSLPISNRFFAGIFASLLSLSASVLMQIVSVPLFLKIGGPEFLGTWLLLLSIFNIISLMDFGYFESISAAMAHHALSSNPNRAQELLDAGLAIIIGLLMIGLIFSAAYIGISEHSYWYKISICFACLSIVFAQAQRLWLACFRSQDNFGTGLLIISILAVVYSIGVLLTAWLSHSIEAVLVCIGAIQFVGTLGIMKLTQKRTGWHGKWGRFNKVLTLAEVKQAAVGNIAMPSALAMWNSGFIIFITSTLGPAAAAVFNTVRVLFRVPLQLHSIFNASLGIKIGHLEITGKRIQAAKLLQVGFGLGLAFFACGFLIYNFGDGVYNLWTKGHLQFDRSLAFFFIFDTGAVIMLLFIFAVLQNRQKTMICGISTFCSISLALTALYFQKYMGWEVTLREIAVWHLTASIIALVFALLELKRTSPNVRKT